MNWNNIISDASFYKGDSNLVIDNQCLLFLPKISIIYCNGSQRSSRYN